MQTSALHRAVWSAMQPPRSHPFAQAHPCVCTAKPSNTAFVIKDLWWRVSDDMDVMSACCGRKGAGSLVGCCAHSFVPLSAPYLCTTDAVDGGPHALRTRFQRVSTSQGDGCGFRFCVCNATDGWKICTSPCSPCSTPAPPLLKCVDILGPNMHQVEKGFGILTHFIPNDSQYVSNPEECTRTWRYMPSAIFRCQTGSSINPDLLHQPQPLNRHSLHGCHRCIQERLSVDPASSRPLVCREGFLD